MEHKRVLVTCTEGYDMEWKVLDEIEVIEQLYNLTDSQMIVYFTLENRATPKEVAKLIRKDRSTTYRTLEKLTSIGLLKKTKVIRVGRRGYYIEYWKPQRPPVFELYGPACPMMPGTCRACKNVLFLFGEVIE